jgi:hypothetical protein
MIIMNREAPACSVKSVIWQAFSPNHLPAKEEISYFHVTVILRGLTSKYLNF